MKSFKSADLVHSLWLILLARWQAADRCHDRKPVSSTGPEWRAYLKQYDQVIQDKNMQVKAMYN